MSNEEESPVIFPQAKASIVLIENGAIGITGGQGEAWLFFLFLLFSFLWLYILFPASNYRIMDLYFFSSPNFDIVDCR